MEQAIEYSFFFLFVFLVSRRGVWFWGHEIPCYQLRYLHGNGVTTGRLGLLCCFGIVRGLHGIGIRGRKRMTAQRPIKVDGMEKWSGHETRERSSIYSHIIQ
ncbi:hypothetical protein CKAH01_10830 [Colletotrichum kahawae]|uniref:Uncharacterized protein n=1 Tax=Colletotrichum kahawae TaxID=34407 RepID=A0AAD9XV69_COLKA|nr:hypothetical protein CKAH01_10830 [Colletotrichum kahawae]